MDIKVNYAGITRRIIAGIIDDVIILVIIPTLFFLLMTMLILAFENNELGTDSLEMAFDFLESSPILFISNYTFFIILEVLMIIRFSGTPGQLFCRIRVRDANTLENITIMQAAIRCVFRDIVTWIIYFSSEGVFICFIATYIAIIFTMIFATYDKRKRFFHDKIARTVVIDYKPSS